MTTPAAKPRRDWARVLLGTAVVLIGLGLVLWLVGFNVTPPHRHRPAPRPAPTMAPHAGENGTPGGQGKTGPAGENGEPGAGGTVTAVVPPATSSTSSSSPAPGRHHHRKHHHRPSSTPTPTRTPRPRPSPSSLVCVTSPIADACIHPLAVNLALLELRLL